MDTIKTKAVKNILKRIKAICKNIHTSRINISINININVNQ